MLPHRFYEHRQALDREFSSPHFDPATGMPPAELEAALKELFNARYGTIPNAILRAQLFAFLYDNVQIEVNRGEEAQRQTNQQQDLQDGRSSNHQEQQRRQQERSGEDFLQQLRLGLIDLQEES